MPLILLIGARLLLYGIGAQSWGEGLGAFVTLWLWAISLVMLLTGTTRSI